MAEKNRLTQADFERLAEFRHALRTFMNFSLRAARGIGLSPQQHQALLAIKGHCGPEPMSIGNLAEQLIIAPHTAAELVGRLEIAGLVDKSEAADDRRKVHLALTTSAEIALLKLTRVHLEELRIIAPRLMRLMRDLASIAETKANAL